MDTNPPAADLTASLLRSASRAPQEPLTPGKSPLFGKGEATADHFRRDRLKAHIVAALQPAAPASVASGPTIPREARLWLRVAPPLRCRLKLAAAVLGQTHQRFLVDALDAAMAEGVTLADDPMAFLHGALEAHLRRFAPSGLLLPADGDDGAEIIAFPQPNGDPTPPRDDQQVRNLQAADLAVQRDLAARRCRTRARQQMAPRWRLRLQSDGR